MTFEEVGNEFPEVWKPEKEGDFIEGIYIRKKEDVGENKSNIYVIDTGGEHRSVWGSTVLDDKMSYCSTGDTIRITYNGDEKNYKKFMVEKDIDKKPGETETEEQED